MTFVSFFKKCEHCYSNKNVNIAIPVIYYQTEISMRLTLKSICAPAYLTCRYRFSKDSASAFIFLETRTWIVGLVSKCGF